MGILNFVVIHVIKLTYSFGTVVCNRPFAKIMIHEIDLVINYLLIKYSDAIGYVIN